MKVLYRITFKKTKIEHNSSFIFAFTTFIIQSMISRKSSAFSYSNLNNFGSVHYRTKSIIQPNQNPSYILNRFTTITENEQSSKLNPMMVMSSSSGSFFENMNNPKTVAAPMVAQSDLAFRQLCRKYDTDLAFTQMIHAKNFVLSETFQDYHLDVYCEKQKHHTRLLPSQINLLRFHENEDDAIVEKRHQYLLQSFMDSNNNNNPFIDNGPVIVQLAGHDPLTMVNAAKIVLERTDHNIAGIDVNLGCPQNIARKGKYGAFLMQDDFDLTLKILSSLRNSLPESIGLSAKIRIPAIPYMDTNNAIKTQEQKLQKQVNRLIEEGKIDLLTVHGRSLLENKTKVRHCHWNMIKKAVEIAHQHNIPVISNGGIEHPTDIIKCLEATKANAVMSSEALLENPGLFSSNASFPKNEEQYTARELFHRQIKYSLEYLDLAALTPPRPGSLGIEGGSFNVVRGHLFKILYRYLECHPDLRSLLGSHKGDMQRLHQAKDLILTLQERHDALSDSEMFLMYKGEGKDVPSSWYRRHRDSITLSQTTDASNNYSVSSVAEKKKQMMERIQILRAQKEKRKTIGKEIYQ